VPISHRGAHDALPENSIPAFLRAIELGAKGIELDVHATRDGTVVVHHDPVIQTGDLRDGRRARIADLTVNELERFPLGEGLFVPTLAEVLHAVGESATVFVEIKARNIEPLVVRSIRESRTDCAVHSFDHRIVKTVKRLFPAIRTGILEVARHLDPTRALAETGAEDLWQHVEYIDEELVTRTHSAGARVIAWTANDIPQWKTLAQIGVDGICTDRIGDLAAAT
jgi:glycerophosphoryl diester phosphodiesterase